MSLLLTPIRLGGLEIRKRIWVSPMCQYSSVDGRADDWHLVHLGSFARGGAGLVLTEASAVLPEGRISPQDAGIWNDEQRDAWSRVVDFVHRQGARVGIQLAHAGRKASTLAPWQGRGPVEDVDGGWRPVGPSGLAFPGLRPDPRPLDRDGIDAVLEAFGAAARRAVEAGFDVLELHAAHGYLLHEFLSPLANDRDDGYGGSFENRVRLTLEVVDAVRAAVPGTPVVVRISATDWTEGGWTADDSVRLSRLLGEPGAVGMLTEPQQAEEVLASGAADVVLLARALLRDPHWALRAAHELGDTDGVDWPRQYLPARLA